MGTSAGPRGDRDGEVTFGSLFTGIGGLDLALEAFGHAPLWQAEMDPYCRRVLEKNWPGVHCYRDVKEIDHEAPPVDIICGGFPCQDISDAGLKRGLAGERSGLWFEFARIVRVLRPRFVFVENVDALVGRGLGTVLGDLAACGYDAEWEVLGACAVGAPHTRERLFIVAYSDRYGFQAGQRRTDGGQGRPEMAGEQIGPDAESGRGWLSTPGVPRVAHGLPRPVERSKALGNAVVWQQAAHAWEALIARAALPSEAPRSTSKGGTP
jgi:DNA (cytosine-5)-methyltransferase 1